MPNLDGVIRSLLILGGARSGKSRYAQRLAEASRLSPVLIATAQAHDAEMATRIARHAALRDARWTVVEEPVALAVALLREARKDRIVVVDCATLWLSNRLLQDDNLAAATQDLAQSVAGLAGPVIFVSNEAGCGIVPENPLARAFRDAQGLLNQALAEACEAVVLVSAGIALRLKPAREPNFRF
ncbi:MAG: bifunctional adenosylcobinamide kinase/adenosylcobinamide-phosphate guanylyltransferase [Pseudomonadota bacterium]|nr:bifunctional adenosylcobinamide kinase/adenosylcobinamide-phosphate guanylyltransferase [Pseudomonadota bacterium]